MDFDEPQGKGRGRQDRGRVSRRRPAPLSPCLNIGFWKLARDSRFRRETVSVKWLELRGISGPTARLLEGPAEGAIVVCGERRSAAEGRPMNDDDFVPCLGRPRGAGKDARYLSLVVKAARRSGRRAGVRSRRFDGSRIGRGAGLARVLRSGDRHAAFRARRVIVKTRLAMLAGKGGAAARAHLRYIQRDGVTREGEPGELYSAERDIADGKAFLERCHGDRHQFRFIVSAEDADQYPDLKPFTRRLMAQMEEDLGTRLEWVAVDHFNTGHPHTHI